MRLYHITEICYCDLAYDVLNVDIKSVLLDTTCDVMTYSKTHNVTYERVLSFFLSPFYVERGIYCTLRNYTKLNVFCVKKVPQKRFTFSTLKFCFFAQNGDFVSALQHINSVASRG